MHKEQIITAGLPIKDAKKVLIMLHGRGATAADILSLGHHLNLKDYALLAPQATNNSWYPNSFLAPPATNEPWLSSALRIVENLVTDIQAAEITMDNIYFLGFSQGACLALEFIARNAARYGGAVAFTGGLIGDKIYKENYTGNFDEMPVFIGTSNPDPHVPVERVNASTLILEDMGAIVTEKVYDRMGHTIIQEEINQVNNLIFSI